MALYYFAYCTWLNPPELARYMPRAEKICKAEAANHRLLFHAAAGRADRGWCHLADTPEALGHQAQGIVFTDPDNQFKEDYDDFERCFLTVRGEDGKTYDCWTYRMIQPGTSMRPPNFYWQHIPDGLKHWAFPDAYIKEVLAVYEAAAPCPRADRSNPSAVPGKSAASR
jgi:hypothetical protein